MITIESYNPAWAAEFAQLGLHLRNALGDVALRIDHIGSTAVVGLAAKPIIDIQISVAALEPVDLYRSGLESLGYIYRADNPERTKRYFREPPGTRRTHVHVRKLGSFSQQFPLLLRDYLRTHPAELAPYESLKRSLAAQHPHDRTAYTNAKLPWFWQTIQAADTWSQTTAWEPGPSDA
ncbi:GrpB family protein [Kribbella sp. NPDC026611]|uniref:GrpB family protein n=1 Tax=Kribbella sp. NPDC026611 TaxID=3154911 RepID=UPI0033CEFA07